MKRFFAIALAIAAGCGARWRHDAPPVRATIDVALPLVEHTQARDGMDVLLVQVPGSGTVRMEVLVRGGTLVDPVAREGLTRLSAAMLLEGTAGGDRQALLDRFGDLGADPSVFVGDTAVGISVTVAREDASHAAALLGEVLAQPTLDAQQIERIRRESIDHLRFLADEPEALVTLAVSRAVLGTEDSEGLGNVASLSAITAEEIAAHLQSLVVPSRAAIVCVGDVALDDAVALARTSTAKWPKAIDVQPRVRKLPVASSDPREILLVTMPGLSQAAIAVAGRLLPRDDPREPAQSLARELAAGLMQLDLRGERQLSYGVVPLQRRDLDGGVFGIWAKVGTDDVVLALGLVLERFEGTVVTGLSADAYEQTRRGELVRTMVERQAFDVTADALREGWAHQLDPQVEQDRLERLAATTPRDVHAAFGRDFLPARVHLVVVGPPELEGRLRKSGLNRRVRTIDRDAFLGQERAREPAHAPL